MRKEYPKWVIALMVVIIAFCIFKLTKSKGMSEHRQNNLEGKTLSKPNSNMKKYVQITIDKMDYIIPYSTPTQQVYIHATKTAKGIVWNPAPPINGKNQLDLYPTEPFSLYLSPMDNNHLDTKTTKKIFTLPHMVQNKKTNEKLYMYLGDLLGLNHWVIYSTYVKSPGMNQPMYLELHALDLDTQKDTIITTYHDSGGYQFSIAASENLLFYVMGKPDSKGNIESEAYVYHLDKHSLEKLESNQYSLDKIDYVNKGKTYHLKLHSI